MEGVSEESGSLYTQQGERQLNGNGRSSSSTEYSCTFIYFYYQIKDVFLIRKKSSYCNKTFSYIQAGFYQTRNKYVTSTNAAKSCQQAKLDLECSLSTSNKFSKLIPLSFVQRCSDTEMYPYSFAILASITAGENIKPWYDPSTGQSQQAQNKSELSLFKLPVSLCLCCMASMLTHAITSWETPLKSDEQYFCDVNTWCHQLHLTLPRLLS